jgi:hypothetical protein
LRDVSQPQGLLNLADLRDGILVAVVSRRHFFFVPPDWRHVTGTMMAALGDLRGFVGERR